MHNTTGDVAPTNITQELKLFPWSCAVSKKFFAILRHRVRSQHVLKFGAFLASYSYKKVLS